MLKENKGVVFIVDISGYSKFVRQISPSNGISVIRSLFNRIIGRNHLSFNISEIEGDAILFYRMGIPPSIEEILRQFADMRNAFKLILNDYASEFPAVTGLDLKAIAHYGYIDEYTVDRFSKLYGNTLVDAHRLLKNSIPSNAYVLLTTDYLEEMKVFPLNYTTSCGTYLCDLYDIGSLCYTYFPFDEKVAYPKNYSEINLSENIAV